MTKRKGYAYFATPMVDMWFNHIEILRDELRLESSEGCSLFDDVTTAVQDFFDTEVWDFTDPEAFRGWILRQAFDRLESARLDLDERDG